MEQTIYHITLVITGLINLGLGIQMLARLGKYRAFPAYRRARICCAVWMLSFTTGYWMHAFLLRGIEWPTLFMALTVTYFHIGTIAFNWGFISFLKPGYLTRKRVLVDIAILLVGLVSYWTAAFVSKEVTLYSVLSIMPFFLYGAYLIIKFYNAYNQASEHVVQLQEGTMTNFVRWLQMCCDLIIVVGLSSVAITGMLNSTPWLSVVMHWLGAALFTYIAYSMEQFGKTLL